MAEACEQRAKAVAMKEKIKYSLVSAFKLMSSTQVMETICENSSFAELYPTICMYCSDYTCIYS